MHEDMKQASFDERLFALCQDYERMLEQRQRSSGDDASSLGEEMKCTRMVIQAYEVLHRDYMRQLRNEESQQS